MRLRVAIDGPAGAGKSTIAKILGKKLDLMYINTGAMYRAVTFLALNNSISENEIDKLCEIIDHTEMCFIDDELYINNENVNSELTLPIISQNVSKYASVKEVRIRLVALQQKMSSKYDVIMDGRDIGTVVLKDAKFKFFLTATPEERATRRVNELISKGVDAKYDQILKEIIDRDNYDMLRETDPLVKASDALEVDTTKMDINGVVQFLYNYIKERI